MNISMLLSIIGWIGTAVYLINHIYISVSPNWKRIVYFGGNLVAASLLVIQSAYLSSWQAVVINGFWMIISACLLAKIPFDSIKLTAPAYYKICTVFAILLLSYCLLSDLQVSIHVIGWSSAFVFCSSYFLFSANRLSSRAYLLLNACAAIALLPLLWINHNWPVFALEIAWASISIFGVIKSYEDIHLID